jgi:DNA-directed RNA polymerase sigma subunit (sigma70/sigma32)
VFRQTRCVPFKPKPRQRGVEKAIQAAVSAHEALQQLEDQSRQLASTRAQAINDALAKGATLRELGERLGLSGERVRQLSKGE